MSLLPTLLPIVRSVFSRWTALQLAVNHSMGGPDSQEKYEALIEAFGQYLIRNIRSATDRSALEQDIQEYLDEILDEEFNTILDDGSSNELAALFIRYIQLIQEGKLAIIQQELQSLQASTPAVQRSVENKNEDDSSLSSENDDNDDNQRISGIQEEDDEEKEGNSTIEINPQAMDVDEDGWITVRRRTGGKK